MQLILQFLTQHPSITADLSQKQYFSLIIFLVRNQENLTKTEVILKKCKYLLKMSKSL